MNKQKIPFNLNDWVRIKLTDHGKAILRANYAEFCSKYPKVRYAFSLPKEDIDGWSDWQLWNLINTFGSYIYMGCDPPFELNIELLKEVE